jgi:hypothetical protein
MSEDLKDFFSLIGKAKKEKEDEFRSLVGEINIESIFSDVKESLKEEKKKKEQKKEKEKRQIQALEEWLYSNPKKEVEEVKEENLVEVLKEDTFFEIVDTILPKPLKYNEKEEILKDEENIDEIENEYVSEEDTIDHALKILEQLKTKEEVQENIKDPEILKIRRELEYLKNLVNSQGGGGEVRLEFLDDIDRTTAKTNNYFLKYDASSDKWIGAATGGAGSQNLDQTLGLGNTSSLGMSVGVITATKLRVGSATSFSEDLVVQGNARVVGILTIGTTSVILSGLNNRITGITTFAGPVILQDNIIGTNASFTGNVSIGGTLTYEDVTNIDSIGLVTARSGINVGFPGIGATINSNGSASFVGIVTATSFKGETSNVTSLILPEGLFSSGVTTTSSTSEIDIDTFSASTYRSAKYQIQITKGSEYQITEICIVHDDTSSYGTEYATVKTESILSSFSTDILSGNVRLLATPTTSSSTTFKLVRTLIEI